MTTNSVAFVTDEARSSSALAAGFVFARALVVTEAPRTDTIDAYHELDVNIRVLAAASHEWVDLLEE